MKPYILGTQIVKNDAVNDLGEREMLMFECDGTYWEQEIKIEDPDNVGWHLHVPVCIDEFNANTVGEEADLDGVGPRTVKLFLRPNKGNFERVRGGIFSDPILESEGEPIDIGFELVQHAQDRKTFIDSFLPNKLACSNKSGVIFIPTRCWSFNNFEDVSFDSDVDWIEFDNVYRETEIETPKNGKGPWLFGANTMKMLNYWKKLIKDGDLQLVFQSFILTVDENTSDERRIGHVNICGEDFTIYQDGVVDKISDFYFNDSMVELSDNEVEIKCFGNGDVPEMSISNAGYEIPDWATIDYYTADNPENQGHYKNGFHPSKGPGKVRIIAEPGDSRICFLRFVCSKGYWRQVAIVQ